LDNRIDSCLYGDKILLFNNCICKVSGLWEFLIAVLICSYPLLFWTVAFLRGVSESEKVKIGGN